VATGTPLASLQRVTPTGFSRSPIVCSGDFDRAEDRNYGPTSHDLPVPGLERIEKAREAAATRYLRDRDLQAIETTMAGLDAEEAEARSRTAMPEITPAEKVTYLRALPRLWADAPSSRRALAESLFASIEVLGLKTMRLEPTSAAIARGLAHAFWCSGDGYGRGERSRADTLRPRGGLAGARPG
jgi:hypothetical protein